MKKIAVILSGCGVYDGAEIYESVLTLLELDRQGASYQCLAPNIEQAQVINHLTGQPVKENRNVLVEAARIARGKVLDLAQAKAADYDALIIPGGFGAAKNLCDFAFKGTDCQVNPAVLNFSKAMAKAGKPVGFICIAPVMIPLIYGAGAKATIGNDKDTASAIKELGGEHVVCTVSEIAVDEQRKIVSTPAYMLAGRISEAHSGIQKLVQKILSMVG